MKFEITDYVNHPVDLVYTTYRDNMVKFVPDIPNVKKLEVLSREEKGDKVLIVNRWYGEHEIPRVVKKLIKKDEVTWIDRAEWVNSEKTCNWEFEPLFFKDYVKAHGRNEFIDDNGKTKIVINGELLIDLKKHPAVPRILIRTVVKAVEKFILALIKPNLTKGNRAVEKYLSRLS